MTETPYDAVMLIAFGGPERMEDVRPFLENVLRGRPVPRERFEEVAHHYEIIGGRSPLNELTEAQRAALQAELARRDCPLPVHVGMRNWSPYIADTLDTLSRSGVRQALAIIMAAHNTEASNERYREAVAAGCARLGEAAPRVHYSAGFHLAPGFIEANAAHVREVIATIPEPRRGALRLVFTAHSIPQAMAASSPYERQLRDSVEAVARAVGRSEYGIAYQSRSGSPRDPWLEPDIRDVVREAGESGIQDLVVSPVGFVCDHVEVLYDLDVEAVQLADSLGVRLHRARTANDHSAFIKALADLVTRSVTD